MNFRFDFLLIFSLFLVIISCDSNQKTTELTDSEFEVDTSYINLGELLDVEEIDNKHESGKKTLEEINKTLNRMMPKEADYKPVDVDEISKYLKPELLEPIWTLLEKSSFENLYDYIDEDKAQNGLPKSDFIKYMNALKGAYGELKNHSAEKYFVRNLMDSSEIMVNGTYKVTFSKIKGKLIMNFIVKDAQLIKLYDISVQPEDYSIVKEFDALTNQTFQYLKAKEYDKIYDSSSKIFKYSTTKDVYDKYMMRFDSIDFNKYILYQNRISMPMNRLRYDLTYEVDNGNVLLTLVITESNNQLLLDGFIYNTKQNLGQ